MQRGVLVAMVLATSVAAAEPARTARLAATGACELASVEARTSELLERTAIAADAAAQVTVVTAQDGENVTATLTVVDENGVSQPSRTVTAASCEELADSVAIVISLVLREAAPAPPVPPPAAPAMEQPRDDTLFTPAPPTTSTRALELGAATSSSGRSALVIGGRLERARTAFVAELAVALPDRVDVLHGTVHVTSARADVAACLRARGFAACGLLGGGVVRARGEDLMDARAAVRPLASLGIRAEWRQRVSRRVGVRLFAGIEQLLVRPSFLVDDAPVWKEPFLQASAGGGIFFQMP